MIKWATVEPVFNTYIGGIAPYYSTASSLATLLGISSSNITEFQVYGENIKCFIDTTYTLGTVFKNDGIVWTHGSILTWYIDDDSMVTGTLGGECFEGQFNLKAVVVNGCTAVNTQAVNQCKNLEIFEADSATTLVGVFTFDACYSLKKVLLPVCTTYSSTVGNEQLFRNVTSIINVIAEPTMATINGGGPEGDLAYVTGTAGGNVYYRANTTAPSAISDLAAGTATGTAVDLSWSAPSSTNTILHYEIWVDGVYNKITTLTSATATQLELGANVKITVRTVDIYGNYSVSNEVTQALSSTYDIPTGSIVSYWNFDSDYTDQVGANDGTATSMSLVASGGIGNVADFTAGGTSKVQVADDNTLSFGNGTTDSAFSGVVRVKFSATGATIFIINKRSVTGTNNEYQLNYGSSGVSIIFFDNSTGGLKRTDAPITLSTGVWYEFGWSYSGSGQPKLFVNGNSVGAANNSGSYTAMENLGSDLYFGHCQFNTSLSLNGYEDELALFSAEASEGQMSDIFMKHKAGLALTA